MMEFENNLGFAESMDQADPLSGYSEKFHKPEGIYFCGNSLGLQPKSVKSHMEKELSRWQKLGVEGWFDEEDPWVTYAESLAPKMAEVVGAESSEVAVMNSLTVNLHLLLSAFYKPKASRYKILIESDAFPSDRYAFESQVLMHGFDPVEGIVDIEPDNGTLISTDRVLEVIEQHGDEIAIVLLGGINYYTGQWFDMKTITKAAREKGCVVGWDLAHAAGNVPLRLHDIETDFAAWCNYKYLNSGPGSVGSMFVHSMHHKDATKPGLRGWWGQDLSTRFNMRQPWDAARGSAGWMISTPTILALSCVRASLELFHQAGIDRLREKSLKLTGYLEYLLGEMETDRIEVITPADPSQRGAQLSIRVKGADRNLFDEISKKGVVADWREPDVIRVAPAPMYNTFTEVYGFVELLKQLV